MVLTSTESIYNHAKSQDTFAYVKDQNLRNLPVILVCGEEELYNIQCEVLLLEKCVLSLNTRKGF